MTKVNYHQNRFLPRNRTGVTVVSSQQQQQQCRRLHRKTNTIMMMTIPLPTPRSIQHYQQQSTLGLPPPPPPAQGLGIAAASSSSLSSMSVPPHHATSRGGSGHRSNTSYCSSHYIQTTHAQIRRKQRNILYKDVKAAIKYGVRQKHYWRNQYNYYNNKYNNRQRRNHHSNNHDQNHHIYKYTYQDIIYIVNEREKKEITCYTKPIQLHPIPIDRMPPTSSSQALATYRRHVSGCYWKSHTIMIIDTSGSMKQSDVWGTRNRLDAVWMAIAIDFIAHRLQQQQKEEEQQQQQPYQNRHHHYHHHHNNIHEIDVMTIILMKEDAQVLYKYIPITWSLYNQIVAIYNQRDIITPSGHGCFIPSITLVEQILHETTSNRNSTVYGCTDTSTILSLLFLSDGVPSDRINQGGTTNGRTKQTQAVVDKIQILLSNHAQYFRTFLFTAIGIGAGYEIRNKNKKMNHHINNNNNNNGSPGTKFPVLQQMVEIAKLHIGERNAQLKVPSMTCKSFGQAFASISTSITTSSSMSVLSHHHHHHRSNRGRQPLQQHQQNNSSNHSYSIGNFRTITQLHDTDQGQINQTRNEIHDSNASNGQVPRESKTKANEPIAHVTNVDFNIYPIHQVSRKVCTDIELIDVQSGQTELVFQQVPFQNPDTRFIAIAKGSFDDGNERYVYRLYEIGADGKTIVGVPMVAKESRGMIDVNRSNKVDYVHTYCYTQQLARQLAIQFNRRLYSQPHHIPVTTPRVSFLDCSVYEINDNGRRFDLLVENRLDCTQWQKWNSNNGWQDSNKRNYTNPLGNIAEENGYIDDDDDDEDKEGSSKSDDNMSGTKDVKFSPSQVAQAFSHFTYCFMNGQRLVCDLQGVYNAKHNTLQLSDPVIHSNKESFDTTSIIRNLISNQTQRTISSSMNSDYHYCNRHGRTDRGVTGIDDFFTTHHCNKQGYLCKCVATGSLI